MRPRQGLVKAAGRCKPWTPAVRPCKARRHRPEIASTASADTADTSQITSSGQQPERRQLALLPKPEPGTGSLLQRPQLFKTRSEASGGEALQTTGTNTDHITPSNVQNHQTPRQKAKRVKFNDRANNSPDVRGQPVEVLGQKVPPPLTSFNVLRNNVSEFLLQNMQTCELMRPTLVQSYAIPAIMQGRDVIATAPPGTGKTAAYALPILMEMMHMNRMRTKNTAYPAAVVLAPSRELVVQIHEMLSKLHRNTHLRSAAVVGGVPIAQQHLLLRGGCDILVATPGRLVDLLRSHGVNLARLRWLVLDEADVLLEGGCEPALRRIVLDKGIAPPGVRQTLMFSTLMALRLQSVAAEFMFEPVEVRVGGDNSALSPLLTQQLQLLTQPEKYKALLAVLGAQHSGQLLVFVEGKQRAEELHAFLRASGVASAAIHADHSAVEREEAMALLRYGAARVLVATGLAARGLHLPEISTVVNFDMPADVGEYVHRVGRTGRGGSPGLAVSFLTQADSRLAAPLADLMMASTQAVPTWLAAMADARARAAAAAAAAAAGKRDKPTSTTGVRFRLLKRGSVRHAGFSTYLMNSGTPDPHPQSRRGARDWSRVWMDAWEGRGSRAGAPGAAEQEEEEEEAAGPALGGNAEGTPPGDAPARVDEGRGSERGRADVDEGVAGEVDEVDGPVRGRQQRGSGRRASAGRPALKVRRSAAGSPGGSARQQLLWAMHGMDPELQEPNPLAEAAAVA